ncbi:copper chaperone PCu(A)C [Sphaerisporangium aureirubrum]|uniref:Copper chaperone PCu(A)C n=1 Tax=Sphaerisporangium aureirubrum TaxID=1544736 RepID=A0ABW1NAX8_9ACTN
MTSTSRRRVTVVTALLALSPALAACGAGPDANTSNAYAPTEANVLMGSSGSAKTYGRNGIKIPQAFLLGPESGARIPAGGALPLFLSMVNYGAAPDTLNGITVAGQGGGTVKAPGPLTLPPGQLVNTGTPTSKYVLQGAPKELLGGESLVLTLSFSNAGDVNMIVPVVTRSREYSSLSPAPSTAPSTAPTPTATAVPSTSATPAPDPSASS